MIVPVASPANCPGVLAVGAMDAAASIANFSNRSINGSGGEVDFVAPGVGVYSAVPGGGYAFKDGTSMAAPHVSGLVALLLESEPNRNANDLYQQLRTLCRGPGGSDPFDFGFGLPVLR